VGSRAAAPNRVRLDPSLSTRGDLEHLISGGFVTPRYRQEFRSVADQILALITPLFRDREMIRIHGDCHSGNLLDRPGEGILLIDFDDMVTGPPAQDLWMLLPDYAHRAQGELGLMLEGYQDFRDFDHGSIRCLEGLRAMRILYFLAWCSRQVHDPCFSRNFPNWGDDAFWRREIAALREQTAIIHESVPQPSPRR
jgi:Ser/Thr protein kinase RdoA (MazF antagonist)